MKRIFALALALLLTPILHATEHYPYVLNFSRNDYDGANQNWMIAENKQGWIYVANNNGLLQFDGSNWQKFEFPGGRYIHSLLIEDERIYAGSYNDFGYFEADSNGELFFSSLTDRVEQSDYNFGNIVDIYSIDQSIYFISNSAVIKYNNDKLSVIESKQPILSSAEDRGSLYLFQQNEGVTLQSGENFAPIITDPLIRKLDICEILPNGKDSFLLVSRFDGIYRCESGKVSKLKLKSEIEKIINHSQIYCAKLSNNILVLGTIDSGAIEIDIESGKHLLYDTSLGLQNNSIHHIHKSQSGNLWLALDNGVSYLEVDTPTKKIYSPSDLCGSGYCSVVHNNTLYLGTNRGLFKTPWHDGDTSLQPQLIDVTKGQVWSLSVVDGKLLCGHHNGVYAIDGDDAKLLHNQDGAWNFKQLPDNPNIMLSGSYNGIALYQRAGKDSPWHFNKLIDGYNGSARVLRWDSRDNTWWVMYGFGVSKIAIDTTRGKATELARFENVDSMQYRTITAYRDTLYFSTSSGIYTYDNKSCTFTLSERFRSLSEQISPISILAIEANENLWIADNNSIKYATKHQNVYSIDSLSAIRLKGDVMDNFAEATPISERKAIITSIDNGFVMTDLNISNESILYPSLRTITRSSENENEIIFKNNFITPRNKQFIKTSYSSGSIYIFNTNVNNIYNNDYVSRFRLKGYNDEWQSLDSSNSQIYNSLHEGTYTFEIESISTLTTDRHIESVTLKITPPWQRTTLAYIIYALIILSIIASIYITIALREKRKYAKRIIRHRQITQDKTTTLINRNIEQNIIIEELKAENLEQELNLKRQELVTTLFEASETQKKFGDIVANLKRIKREARSESEAKHAIENLIVKINTQIDQEDKWDKLSDNYNAVHAQFLTRFKESYPELTNSDLKLSAYIRMGLQSKDIAPLLSVSERGVESARYRLRRKLELDRSKSLSLFIQHF